MATISALRTATSTLTGTGADLVQLTQAWDRVEVSTTTAAPLYVRFGGVTAVGAADGTQVIPASGSKTFMLMPEPGGVAGSTTAPMHKISLVGTANVYTVVGIAGL